MKSGLYVMVNAEGKALTCDEYGFPSKFAEVQFVGEAKRGSCQLMREFADRSPFHGTKVVPIEDAIVAEYEALVKGTRHAHSA